jgi:hypothetical protein
VYEDNYIVEEIRSIRETMLAEYGGDIHALIYDMNKQAEDLAKAGRVVITRGPRPVEPQQTPVRKVGCDGRAIRNFWATEPRQHQRLLTTDGIVRNIQEDKAEPAGASGGGMGGIGGTY